MLLRVLADKFVTVTVATGGSSLSSKGMSKVKFIPSKSYLLLPMVSVAARIQKTISFHFPFVEVELYILPEVLPCDLGNAVAGDAGGDDDRDWESLVLHHIEQGTSVADDFPESKDVPVHVIQVNREEFPGGVVLDRKGVSPVGQLHRERVRHP